MSRKSLLLITTLSIPFVVFGLVEIGFRLADRDGGLPLFVESPIPGGAYLVGNPGVGKRWFSGVDSPPGPMLEPFTREKGSRGFRVFVLGESSTAGFPYPRNVTFSRLLGDVLRDVLPGENVEIINLGIAATNSYAIADMAKEIARQQPDAVLIYAGHNEYYGALGIASREGLFQSHGLTRLYQRLLRLRSVLALRNLIADAGPSAKPETELEAASLMELLARDREIPLGGAVYLKGVHQLESNLSGIVRVFAARGIPVFIGSAASNLRDQHPFAAAANAMSGGAVAVFREAHAAIGAADSTRAGELFASARDLDVVRFRAPTEFNAVIRRVARRPGSHYVPVAEAFSLASPGGVPGRELFLEHVHPNPTGHSLIARTFYHALVQAAVLPKSFDPTRLRSWGAYENATFLSAFDERIALHTVRTLTSRWPFVPVSAQRDYRGEYRPADELDSLAFAVSRGAPWEVSKLKLAAFYERRKEFDSAATEYRGLARDAPLFEEPWRFLGRALQAAGRAAAADSAFRRAVAIRPTAASLAALGYLAVQRRDFAEGAAFFQRSFALDQTQTTVLYQLSLAYGMARDLPNARATALRLRQVAPRYPGLAEWMAVLGLGN